MAISKPNKLEFFTLLFFATENINTIRFDIKHIDMKPMLEKAGSAFCLLTFIITFATI